MEAQLTDTPRVGFPLFSSLPQELRDQIWETAATLPQHGVNYFSVRHSRTAGVLTNCIEGIIRDEQGGPRLLPPFFDANDIAPLSRSWFKENPSTYSLLVHIALACKESRAAIIRMAKLGEKASADTTTTSSQSKRISTTLIARQDSKKIPICLRLSQDLVYLKFNKDVVPSDDEFLSDYNTFQNPLRGHFYLTLPQNIAIELDPKIFLESRWVLLAVLCQWWLKSGIGVWILHPSTQSEPTVLDRSYKQRSTLFRDAGNCSYMTMAMKPTMASEVFAYYNECDPWVSELALSVLDLLIGFYPSKEVNDCLSRFGLLFRQEHVKFC